MPRSTFALALVLPVVLAACAQPGGTGSTTAAGSEMATAAPAASAGGCGAETRQSLIGQSVSVLDASALPPDARVLFPGMSASSEFRPGRLNIVIGGGDQVERVYCG